MPKHTALRCLPLKSFISRYCLAILSILFFTLAAAQHDDLHETQVVANYEELRAGTEAASNGDCNNAIATLTKAASESVFVRHSIAIRQKVLMDLVACLVSARDYEETISYIRMGVDLGGASAPTWLRQLLLVGMVTKQPEIAVDAVRQLAALDVNSLNSLDISVLFQLHGFLNGSDPSGELKFSYLQALHTAGYSPDHPFYTTDDFMIDYAVMLAERGDRAQVAEIVLGIQDPGLLVRIHVDKRFDFLRNDPALSSYLDLEAAAERNVKRYAALVEEYPEYAVGPYYHANALVALWRFEEALAVIEPVAMKVRFPFNIGGYTDIDFAKSWVLALYSKVLQLLEYPEQAGAMYVESADPPDFDGDVVSHRINLLSMSLYGGYLKETHEIARRIDLSQATTFGKMWVHATLVCVNVMGERISDYSASESFLLQNERANPGALTLSLLCKNDMTAAARQMIRRLEDPELRIGALLYMQYTGGDWEAERLMHEHQPGEELLPGHLLWHRFDELRNREDVANTVNRVGRLIEVPLYQDAWHRH